jgi:nitrous oxide reductase accessory protein NosL
MHRRAFLAAFVSLAFAHLASAEEKAAVNVLPPAIDDELREHPRCVICNMDRRRFHHARHLLVYGDDSVQGTCSVHCAAECMLRERRKGFRAIFAPDYATPGEPKPLVEALSATYLIGSDLPGVMTPVSKVAFASRDAALAAQKTYGGQLSDFAGAIRLSMEETANSLLRRYDNDRERLRRKAG